METNKNYFLVGLFILITVLGAVGFSVWLSARGKGEYSHYRIHFAESVSGLSVGGLVKFRGVDVGNVEAIQIDPNNINLIRVDVKVLDSAPVKTDTVASLKLQGITGVVFVELTGGSPKALSLSESWNGEGLPMIRAQQSSIDAIVNQLPLLVEKATRIVDQVNKLLEDKNIEAMGALIEESHTVATALARETAQIDDFLKNGNRLLGRWNQITVGSEGDIKDTVAHLNRTSAEADRLIRNLNGISRNVGRFSEQVKENPSSLIFRPAEKGIPAP